MDLNKIILGVDVGSTKICSIIAEIRDGMPHVLGSGIKRSQGVKKGAIINIEQASRAISSSINEAKMVAGIDVSKAIISVSGVYTRSTNSSGVVNIPSSEIGLKEINRVLQTSLYNATIPSEYEVIHVLPYNFKLDEQDHIDNPMGMSGTRLEVFVHIVIAQRSALENLKRAIKNAGVEIENIVLSAYASSISVLNDDEKELGVACIDIGGSTSDLMIHLGNAMRYNDFLGVGSNHITNDIATAVNTPLALAEDIKLKYGGLIPLEDNSEYMLDVPTIGNENRPVALETIQKVVSSRVIETLSILAKSIDKSELKDQLGAGIVLTGGMANITGLRDIAMAIFPKLPIRVAKPIELSGIFENLKYPNYSTAVGLILYGSGKYAKYELDSEKTIRYKREKVLDDINLDINEENRDLENVKLRNIDSPKPYRDGVHIKKNITNANPIVKLKNWFMQLF